MWKTFHAEINESICLNECNQQIQTLGLHTAICKNVIQLIFSKEISTEQPPFLLQQHRPHPLLIITLRIRKAGGWKKTWNTSAWDGLSSAWNDSLSIPAKGPSSSSAASRCAESHFIYIASASSSFSSTTSSFIFFCRLTNFTNR